MNKQIKDPIPEHIKDIIIQFFAETSAPRILKKNRKSKAKEVV